MISPGRQKIIFVTGTDTGVGKTVATVSLLHYLRKTGVHALAMKPFCTGDRADIEAIQAVQESDQISMNQVNPFFFSDPVSPYAAQRRRRTKISLREVLDRIRIFRERCSVLIVEGVGGLMVPLGESYSLREIIREVRGEVMVVAQNRLGTVNHTLLTVASLRGLRMGQIRVLLMENGSPDFSSKTNFRVLSELLPGSVKLTNVPYLGVEPKVLANVKNNCRKMEKVLAPILG